MSPALARGRSRARIRSRSARGEQLIPWFTLPGPCVGGFLPLDWLELELEPSLTGSPDILSLPGSPGNSQGDNLAYNAITPIWPWLHPQAPHELLPRQWSDTNWRRPLSATRSPALGKHCACAAGLAQPRCQRARVSRLSSSSRNLPSAIWPGRSETGEQWTGGQGGRRGALYTALGGEYKQERQHFIASSLPWSELCLLLRRRQERNIAFRLKGYLLLGY